MARAVLLLVTVGVAVYAIVDCVRSRRDEVRLLPRSVWVAVIALFPLAGALVYLAVGRQQAVQRSGPTVARRTLAPDDDPEFLRALDAKRRQEERRRRERTKQEPSERAKQEPSERAEQEPSEGDDGLSGRPG
jgi:hypothetical protein